MRANKLEAAYRSLAPSFLLNLPGVGLGDSYYQSPAFTVGLGCGGRDFFAQGDYFVDMGMNLISSEPQLLRKTLGIYTRMDPE